MGEQWLPPRAPGAHLPPRRDAARTRGPADRADRGEDGGRDPPRVTAAVTGQHTSKRRTPRHLLAGRHRFRKARKFESYSLHKFTYPIRKHEFIICLGQCA